MLWSWAQVGDLLEEEFTLRNESWLPVLWAEVRDYSSIPGYAVARVEVASSRSVRTWRTRAICRMRGHFRLGPWSLHLGDPLRIFEIIFEFSETEDVVVFPPIIRMPQLSLPRGVASGSSRNRTRTRETTVDVAGVRQYLPGDSLNHVHWRTVARQQELYVKQFDREPSGSLWIALDLDDRVQAGSGERSTVEYAVTTAASLAHMVFRDNRPVGLACAGDSRLVIPPGVGLNHFWALMRALTLVQSGTILSLAELLEDWRRIAARDATLAVITPSTERIWLDPLMRIRGRGVETSVTLLDAESFDGRARGLSSLITLLSDLGVESRVVDVDMEFEHLVPLAYRGMPRFKVGATGRAIPIKEPIATRTQ